MQQGLSYELDQVMPEVVASGLLDSLCSFSAPSNGFGPSGAPDRSWVAVSGLQNIRCTAPPPSEIRIQANEVRTLQEILSLDIRHVLLEGYYPQIESFWRATIDGVNYDIMGSESDSQKRSTRMDVRVAAI